MASKNIDGSFDPYYRYKMPALKLIHRKKQTIMENAASISKSLSRPLVYLQKFLSKELGTVIKVETNQLVIAGTHSVEVLDMLLVKFIKLCIICQTCVNPETKLIVKKSLIELYCTACGCTSKVSSSKHSLIKYICSGYKPSRSETIQNIEQESALEDWSCDTSEEAVSERMAQAFGPKKKAVSVSPQVNSEDEDFIVFETPSVPRVIDHELEAFIDGI